MAKLRITDLWVYRLRYVLGYGVLGLILLASLVFAGLFAPGGLTAAEMNSTVVSANTNIGDFDSLTILNLPYQLLQNLSISTLGVSVLSVKLPSLLLGLLTAIGLILLLRRWFSRNVAVIAAIIAVSTSQFLFVAQNGTPMVMYMFWAVWLLLSATMVARRAKPALFWRLICLPLAALSLYTPLSIYILFTIMTAVALHPHLRYLFKRVPIGDLVFGAVIGGLLLIPLGYNIVTNPETLWALLGYEGGSGSLASNAAAAFNQLFNFTGSSFAPSGMMTPLFSLGSVLLIIIGAVNLSSARYSVKTYLTAIWLLLLVPAIFINPSFVIVSFVPFVLLLASGLDLLIGKWYRLFPLNPYARVAGLIPLAILVGGLVFSGLDRYIYGYHYTPEVAKIFSTDIDLLNKELARSDQTTQLVVNRDQVDFYQVVADQSSVDIAVESSQAVGDLAPRLIIAGSEVDTLPESHQLDRVIASDRQEAGDRFYVYKKTDS